MAARNESAWLRSRRPQRRSSSPDETVAAPVLVRRIEAGAPLAVDTATSFAETLSYAEEADDRMTLTVLSSPDAREIAALADAWSLHPVLTEDLLHAGQRPKLERYDDTLFVVLRPPATSMRPKRSSSANCTSSPGRTS